jgi:hypothetical protein
MGGGCLAEGTSAEGCKVGFADLDRSAPGSSPQQAKSALAGGPDYAAHDDRLRRGEFHAARLKLSPESPSCA